MRDEKDSEEGEERESRRKEGKKRDKRKDKEQLLLQVLPGKSVTINFTSTHFFLSFLSANRDSRMRRSSSMPPSCLHVRCVKHEMFYAMIS